MATKTKKKKPVAKKKPVKKTAAKKKKVVKKKAAKKKIGTNADGSESKHHLKGMRKLDKKIVQAIRKNYKNGEGMTFTKIHGIVVDRGYAVTYASVRNVCLGITWKSLP